MVLPLRASSPPNRPRPPPRSGTRSAATLLISFPRQEPDEIRHCFKQHIFVDLYSAAVLV
jgi:hypothetical protein